jgi:hypothetical protein
MTIVLDAWRELQVSALREPTTELNQKAASEGAKKLE